MWIIIFKLATPRVLEFLPKVWVFAGMGGLFCNFINREVLKGLCVG